MFLVFGGEKDFNLKRLIKELEGSGRSYFPIILSENNVPDITWDLMSDKLIINNKMVSPTAVFLRNDVFNSIKSNTSISYTWYKTLREWAFAHEKVLIFNQQYIGMNKSYNLALAKKIGFDIPYTLITNQINLFNQLENPSSYIAKPVTGGQYTITLETFIKGIKEKKEKHPPITYIQNRLKQPEMRIFGIANQFLAFSVISNQLDYRTDKAVKVVEMEVPKSLSTKLALLMKQLKLDFAAADFKTCPDTGKYLFLEVNSGPMFGKFDSISKGKICRAIINWHH